MIITKDLSKQIEQCIQQTHVNYVASTQTQSNVCESLPLSTGAACFAGHDSFLSQVIGWGFEVNSSDLAAELQQIEDFYISKDHLQCDIELSEMTGIAVAQSLQHKGYQIDEFNHIAYFDLAKPIPIVAVRPEIQIRIATDNELTQWAHVVATGFDASEVEDQFYDYANTNNVYPFVAFHNGRMASGGTIAIHDGICDLGVTSTLAEFRGMGIQKALLQARLEFAKQQQAALATVTVRPGSISEQNIQKIGFSTAYTRIKWSRNLVK